MKLEISTKLTYYCAEQVPFIMIIRPKSGIGQQVLEDSFVLEPSVPFIEYEDVYGNQCQRFVNPIGNFSIITSSLVETASILDIDFNADAIPIEHLPTETLTYLLPSRLAESDQFTSMAFNITKNFVKGYAKVEAIRQWVNENIKYEYGYSSPTTSAVGTNQLRIGVCRDFAHLCIALCRSINIPARMVAGYMYQLEPMDLHAWFEVYLENQWYTFDATQQKPMANRVVLAYGRDAGDVAFATQFGNIQLNEMVVSVNALAKG
jgi:transglutaminase-like putative cysteine protease